MDAAGPSTSPSLAEAIARLRGAGLLAATQATPDPADPAAAAAAVAGRPWAAVRPVLAPLGFAEVGPDSASSRLFAAYDPADDQWLRLRLEPTGPDVRGRGARDRRAPGLIVAVLGPDGSGKSTLTADLARTFILPTTLLYAGLYPAGRRRFRLPALGTIALLLRLWRLGLDATWQRSRGRLVLFDRYASDARLPMPAGAGRSTRLRRGLLARALPAPDLTIVLDAPTDVLLGRRQEQPAEVIAIQRDRYAELAQRVRDGVVVDASADAEAVRRTVTALIWSRVVDRRGGRNG